jgi:Fe-S-cluster containining protein
MHIVPWNVVNSWHCNMCGICCKQYDVVLKFPEWLGIVKTFGAEYTAPTISRFSLGRSANGSCLFLQATPTTSFCGLQHAKPQACKLWPFKVLDKPKYGRPNDAVYNYGSRKLFVYVDPACPGLRFGVPSPEFAYSVVPEFVEIALGNCRRQFKSTAVL